MQLLRVLRDGYFQRLVTLLALAFATEQSLMAYVDPGSGTLTWQIIVGSLVGISFEFRRMKRWIKRKIKAKAPEPVPTKTFRR